MGGECFGIVAVWGKVIKTGPIMKIKKKEELNRFTISVHDFEEAKKFLAEARQQKFGSVSCVALLIVAIIYFARPFSSNEKDKNSNAISKIEIDWFTDISSEEKELFDDLIRIRNKCLAHAEFQYYPASIDDETGVIRSRRFSILEHPIDLNVFQILLDKLINQSHNNRVDYSIALRNLK